jgi:hypothetical protein
MVVEIQLVFLKGKVFLKISDIITNCNTNINNNFYMVYFPSNFFFFWGFKILFFKSLV